MALGSFIDKHTHAITFTLTVCAGLMVSAFFVFDRHDELSHREALSILTSNDIANGHLTIMRPGSASTGALEQYIGALFAVLFGTSPVVTIAPRLVLFAGTCFLLWKAFSQTPHANDMKFVASALAVTLLCVLFFAHTTGGATMSLTTCFVACLACAYFAAHSLRNVRFFYWFAFLAGISLWVSILSVLFIVPTTIWILRSSRALRPKCVTACGFFLVGSSPWWVFNIMNGFVSLRSRTLDGVLPTPRADDFDVARITGLSPSLSRAWDNQQAAALLSIASIITVAVLVLFFLNALWKILRQRKEFSRFEYLVVTIALSGIVLYGILWLFDFHTVLATNILVGISALVVCTYKAKTLSNIAILCCLVFLTSMYFVTASNAEITTHDQRNAMLVALEKHDVASAFSSHLLAYPLVVEADDDLVLTPYDSNIFDERRNDKVHVSTDAFLVSARSRVDTWFILCVQSFTNQSFERIQLEKSDLYLVADKDKQRVGRFVSRCYASARDFTSAH